MSPKIKNVGFESHGHVQKSENPEHDGFSVFPNMNPKSYKSRMKQNNSTELSWMLPKWHKTSWQMPRHAHLAQGDLNGLKDPNGLVVWRKGGSQYVEGYGDLFVSWFLDFSFFGLLVPCFRLFSVPWFLSFLVSWFPIFKVSNIHLNVLMEDIDPILPHFHFMFSGRY